MFSFFFINLIRNPLLWTCFQGRPSCPCDIDLEHFDHRLLFLAQILASAINEIPIACSRGTSDVVFSSHSGCFA